jgi:glycosyltransferase involved in cell wall biosynthesis
MKVLMVAYECVPNAGSEMGRGWNYPLHIAKLGHEVWVLSRLHPETEKALASLSMPNLHFIYVDFPEWINFCRPYELNIRWLILLSYLTWQKQAYNIALKLDETQKFDVVHHVTMANLRGGSWLRKLNKPFIFGPVGGGQIAPPAFKKYFLKGWASEAFRSFTNKHLSPFNPLLSETVKQADLVLAANRDTADLAQRSGARRVELFFDVGLPEDYFPEEAFTRLTSPDLRLIWVGQIIPRKGLPLALEALSKVKPSIPFKLTILGKGYLSKYIPEWIHKLSLEDKVEYLGSLPWKEVKNKYQNSDVFLFTSLRESGGNVLIESMSHSLPVITLNHHGPGDIVPDCAGIKVPVTTNPSVTVNALAQAVEYMYENPDKRLEMAKIAYEFAKAQTWSQKAIKISRYYEEIVLRS